MYKYLHKTIKTDIWDLLFSLTACCFSFQLLAFVLQRNPRVWEWWFDLHAVLLKQETEIQTLSLCVFMRIKLLFFSNVRQKKAIPLWAIWFIVEESTNHNLNRSGFLFVCVVRDHILLNKCSICQLIEFARGTVCLQMGLNRDERSSYGFISTMSGSVSFPPLCQVLGILLLNCYMYLFWNVDWMEWWTVAASEAG